MGKTVSISCEECLAMLDVAICDMLNGNSIHSRYPSIHQHLQECKRCNTIFNQMLINQDQEYFEQFMQDPGNLGADTDQYVPSLDLSPSAPEPWEKIKCLIPGAQLKAIITVPPPSGTRSTNKIGELDWLLFVDQVYRNPESIAIQISLKSTWFGPEQLSLVADISSDHPLPQVLEAKLNWGQISRTAKVDETGRAVFDQLPSSLGYPPIPELKLEVNVGT